MLGHYDNDIKNHQELNNKCNKSKNQYKINNLIKSKEQDNINKINYIEKSAVSRRNFVLTSTV